MTVTFYGLWMLCMLGAVVCAAAAATHVRALVAMAAGLIAGVVWASPVRLPDTALVGGLATAAAAIYLFRPRWRLVTAVVGGLLAGLVTGLLEVQGAPPWASALVSTVVLAIPVWLARSRPSFAPEQLRDEGMLAMGILALGVAVLPGILDGWQAAATLSAASERVAVASVPVWTVALLFSSSFLGACYAIWSRR